MTILLALAAAAAQPADTPRGFMERLYANYRNSDYSPFKHPDRVFAPRLLAAINEDSKLAHGEVGALDGDPLCDCQDTASLSMRILSFSQPTPRAATARVHVALGAHDSRNLRLSLVRTPSGWRVADMVDPYGRSLLRALEESNRKARAKH